MQSPIGKKLVRLARRSSRTCIGLMSGTSCDGLDVALVRLSGSGSTTKARLQHFRTFAYPHRIRSELLAAGQLPAAVLARLNFSLSEYMAKCVNEFLRRRGLVPEVIDFIAAYNISVAYSKSSVRRVEGRLAIVEPGILAERTGILVVDDMRTRDIAAGGTGAPLSPYADWVLFRDPIKGRAVLNIGGIANVAVLPPRSGLVDVFGFDTGPGNMVIDGAVRSLTGGRQPFDRDGRMARRGAVNGTLLKWMLKHPFITSPPPKAAGAAEFGESYVRKMLKRARDLRLSKNAIAATATACTVESIALNFERFVLKRCQLGEVILGGGGVFNPILLEGLRSRLPFRILRHEDFGIPSKAREALTWAILANEAVMGNANNVPGVTGASKRIVMGRFTPADGGPRRG